MAYANISDVEARLGRPISAATEIAQVNAWLSDVESQISARFRRFGLVLSEQIAAGNPDLATVVRVEASVVVRRVQNPEPGRTSTTRSVDDASVTDRWETGGSPWDLTESDWFDLLPASSSGAFSTRPGFEPGRTCPQEWL